MDYLARAWSLPSLSRTPPFLLLSLVKSLCAALACRPPPLFPSRGSFDRGLLRIVRESEISYHSDPSCADAPPSFNFTLFPLFLARSFDQFFTTLFFSVRTSVSFFHPQSDLVRDNKIVPRLSLFLQIPPRRPLVPAPARSGRSLVLS